MKYARQLKRAIAQIKAKGTQCTWTKSVASTDPDDTPEFPGEDTPETYVVDLVFIPMTAQQFSTVTYSTSIGGPVLKLFAYMAGAQQFTPEEGDKVTLPDDSNFTVSFLNTTQPDLQPIIYEVGLS